MKTAQSMIDKFSIGLSMMCAIHCLMLPMLLSVLPTLAGLPLNSELFHVWMVVAVIPSSIFALALGSKQHKRYRLVVCGGFGLAMLVLALVLGENYIGEAGEKLLTLVGSAFVAIAHLYNYRLCHGDKTQACSCPNT
ncbi:MerC domain-containing protein [Pseudoalteromonas sp. T1lg65]|uniref:MerC domain-containing protein n=1 Tax=Pseudoalteromonas sp. T1lg65 TaxID=2077101 RepID=UPI003F79178A